MSGPSFILSNNIISNKKDDKNKNIYSQNRINNILISSESVANNKRLQMKDIYSNPHIGNLGISKSIENRNQENINLINNYADRKYNEDFIFNL